MFHGFTMPPPARPYSLSAFERYQDCPFKFFAADVLGLKEGPEDESTPSPRARGRFIHEVFERFFEIWDSRVGGAITTERLDQALDSSFARANGMVSAVPHPAKGELRVLANPLRIDGERPSQAACSPLGADNDTFLGKPS